MATAKVFIDGDFKNIEGRLSAWFAGEAWKLQAFRDFDAGIGPDLYKVAYARSFGVPLEGITKAQRQNGKTQELFFQYQGAVGAILRAKVRTKDLVAPMRAAVSTGEWRSWAERYPAAFDKLGLVADEWIACKVLISKWRTANPKIAASWGMAGRAAIEAVDNRGKTITLDDYQGVKFHCEKSMLFISLPSGSNLHYWNPVIRVKRQAVIQFDEGFTVPEEDLDASYVDLLLKLGLVTRKEGYPQKYISYEGREKVSSYLHPREFRLMRKEDAGGPRGPRIDGWGQKGLYGGLIVENIVQRARNDVQMLRMVELADAGFEIALHSHDSITAPIDASRQDELKHRFQTIMGAPLPWAPDLPLGVSVHASERYS